MKPAPLAPSDLHGQRSRRTRLRVAGRVFIVDGEVLQLADAESRIEALGQWSGIEPGQLVIVSGRWTGRALVESRVEWQQAAPTPRGDGEFARLVLQGAGPRLRARARGLAVIRRYFEEQGFLEVETPLRVPAPYADANIEAVRAPPDWLITSPELQMKRLVVGGIARQFQLARVSRREERGALHEPEFTLLEWYRAFAGFEHVLRDTEVLVSRVARALRGRAELVAPGGLRIDARPPFERVSVAAAFRKHAGVRDVSDLASTDEDRYFELLVSRVEPALAAHKAPVFLYEYPVQQASLSRPCAHDPRFAERFELYAGGVELCNGYGELTDPGEQRRRFALERGRRRRQGRAPYPLDQRFLAALMEGMPPTGGNALGVDRLLMLALGAERVQDVLAFPRDAL